MLPLSVDGSWAYGKSLALRGWSQAADYWSQAADFCSRNPTMQQLKQKVVLLVRAEKQTVSFYDASLRPHGSLPPLG